MKERPFSLESLLLVRARRAEEALRTLAESIARRSAKSEVLARSEKRHAEQLRRTESVRNTELEAFSKGTLRAADLQQAESWGARAKDAQARLVRDTELARRAFDDALAAERKAQERLALAFAEQAVVTQAKARQTEETRKAMADADEESAMEAWRPRRP